MLAQAAGRPGPARRSSLGWLVSVFVEFVHQRSDFLYYRDESGRFGLAGARRPGPARRSSSQLVDPARARIRPIRVLQE